MTKILGKKISYYNKIDSTQNELWRRVTNNKVQNGEVIVAKLQMSGIRNSWENMVYR